MTHGLTLNEEASGACRDSPRQVQPLWVYAPSL